MNKYLQQKQFLQMKKNQENQLLNTPIQKKNIRKGFRSYYSFLG